MQFPFTAAQLIPAVSALNPVTTALPLAFVLIVTGVKDGYDDYVRYSIARASLTLETATARQRPGPEQPQDQRAAAWRVRRFELSNACPKSSRFVSVAWQDVTVGEIVQLKNMEPVPVRCAAGACIANHAGRLI